MDVAGPFPDRRRPAQGPGLKPFHGGSLIDRDSLHHQTIEVTSYEDLTLLTCAIVQVADDLVRRQRIGFSGTREPWEPVGDVLKRVGLSEENARDIFDRLIERLSVRSVILDIDLPESALYLECLQKANGVLGEVMEKLGDARLSLEQSNRRLRAVTDLHMQLGISFDCGDVLAGIADSVQRNSGARKVISYCIDEKGHTSLGSVKCPDAAPRPFFISAVKGSQSDVGGLGQDREALRYLVGKISGHLDEETGPAMLAAGRLAFMPVKVGAGQRAGLLVEAANGRPIDQEDLRFFAEASAVILERALLEERLRKETEKVLDSNRRSKNFYEELVNARKLAAIGRMAAGAAHEINNPLAIVSGRVQLLLKMESDEGKKRHLDMIRSQCDRMGRIISDILTFARPEKPVVRSVQLKEIVDAAVSLVESDASAKRVKITSNLQERLPAVAADAAKMEQAFRNILANAIDASSADKEIVISAEVDEKGKFLHVSFADNGVGMDEETLGRVFEPFFTTKEGRGTGLGLSICHSIVQTHGGKIRVRSTPGKGTTFTVIIPAWRGE